MFQARKRRRNTTYAAQQKRRARIVRLGLAALAMLLIALAVAYKSLGWNLDHPPTTQIAAPKADGITLSSVEEVLSKLGAAKTVTLSAFSLSARAPIVLRLEEAADSGARVSVALDHGFGLYVAENEGAASAMQAHGIRVHVVGGPQHSIHLKAAILDGVLYLSDRNWPENQVGQIVVIRDDVPGDRTLIERALLGEAVSNDHLWTQKADALAAEARMLGVRRSKTVRISTESFSADTPVYQAMLDRAAAGDDVRLLVSNLEYRHRGSERTAVATLREHGVKVLPCDGDEKFALDGDAVWIGSANATHGVPNQVEFGLLVENPRVAERLFRRFDTTWRAADSEHSQ